MAAQTMRAWRTHRYGRPTEVLSLDEVEVPSPGDGEVRVRIDPEALKRAKGRLRQLTSRKRGVSMEQRIEEINRFTVGWTAYFALADTPTVLERLDRWLRRRLRQVRWKEEGVEAPENQAAKPEGGRHP